MANKHLFHTGTSTVVRNEAGGKAFAFSPEHALAQYAVTGTFHGTFYADADDQLAKVQELAGAVAPELVAKTAIYCRQNGRMKDVPAFLVALLATRDVGLMLKVFPRVIDDARMLRAFVSIVRSGVTGRKSFGSAPKRALRAWFAARSPETLFRQSIGQSPSMSDVIKMVRPPPRNDKGEADAVREALYGYLIGKNVDHSKLPALAIAYEAFKAAGGPLPDVPFEMLTALPLRAEHWIDLAKKMTFGQLRQNLNTLFRHGVFADEAMIALVAERLSDPEAIRRARTMPYQLLAAHRSVTESLPKEIKRALGRAVEHAVANVPSFPGSVALCPDVSGSMHSPLTGRRGTATTKVRCVDVAALVTAAFLRKNEEATVLPFSDHVVALERPINALDSVVANTDLLSSLPSGGTACAAPLRWLNERNEAPDLVVFVSDNQSWADFKHDTTMDHEWNRLRERNPNAKLVLIDLQPYATTQVETREEVLNVGGFSDAVFDVVASFVTEGGRGEGFLDAIQAVTI
ncbi:MAG: TROVE domain-containing protein [Labilithrix sp.]|nr:TROVE domain-containing protein [Labilithrix sp.]MCW5815904.1 TROVE domain-containing protein [Labilithrix sp.]